MFSLLYKSLLLLVNKTVSLKTIKLSYKTMNLNLKISKDFVSLYQEYLGFF